MKAKPRKTKPGTVTRASKASGRDAVARIPSRRSLYVVGVGSSAGGLEALEDFFQHLPADPGAAFVLVPHLDPTHKPLLTGLLQRSTQMKVCEIQDRTKVRRNCVYVIPPNKDLSIEHGMLRLMEVTSPRGLRMPIDFFLRRLAHDQENRAIGIILSGMGSDGSLGLKAIKDKMGLAMVQEPASAKYEGMPRSAVETGLVDFVAPPAQLAARLIKFVQHSVKRPHEPLALADQGLNALQRIFSLLREQTGHDFSFYKKNTLYRRIERRMTVHGHHHIQQYVRYLQDSPEETKLLFKELLIGVTNFFRDPEAWEVLGDKAIPQLLKSRTRGNTLRVWVPGCSSGEEAYSTAIVLRECQEKVKPRGNFKVQIFATDIDATTIEVARQGFYPENIAADVSPGRLQQFFTREENGYRIKKHVREMVIFAPQNIIMDPPFTKLDLICCRNLLIYFTPELQKKVLPLFHYTLNPGGLLMLGTSETIGVFTDRFSVVDNSWKIFARKESASASPTLADLPSSLLNRDRGKSRKSAKSLKARDSSVPDLARRIILEHYTPAAVLVNAGGDILYISGRTGNYLEPSPGKANLNILAMAREGLRLELASAMRRALSEKSEIRLRSLKIRTNGGSTFIDLTVRPLTELDSTRGLCLVIFEEVEPRHHEAPTVRASRSVTAPHRSQVTDLERELKQTREQLQTTVEEMESSQEELKSANEELQSTNEELQSTNEELTTSKEEMQSLNEELVTVNTELQVKVDELSQTSNDMKNLLNSTELATVFLDNALHIKRYTPQATRIVNLIPGDVGRPLEHIVANLRYESLARDARDVLESLASKEVQVQTTDNRWVVMRIMPYRTLDNVIDGVVITFIDSTALNQMNLALRESEQRLRLLMDNMPVMLAAFDEHGTVLFWNRECERVTGWKAGEMVGNPNALPHHYPNDAYRAQLIAERHRLEGKHRQLEVQMTCKDGTEKTISWSSMSGEAPMPGWKQWSVGWEVPAGSGGADFHSEGTT
jgi:two-component system CheB/CheR fusion protein